MNDNARYITHDLFNLVEQEVLALQEEFQQNKGLILTEGDLQSHLFAQLSSRFHGYFDTMDRGTTGVMVHSEISYYSASGKLVHKPDICIIPPGELSIYKPIELEGVPGTRRRSRLPSKGFQFAGDSLAMEVKFCRKTKGLTEKDIQHYQKDFNSSKHFMICANSEPTEQINYWEWLSFSTRPISAVNFLSGSKPATHIRIFASFIAPEKLNFPRTTKDFDPRENTYIQPVQRSILNPAIKPPTLVHENIPRHQYFPGAKENRKKRTTSTYSG